MEWDNDPGLRPGRLRGQPPFRVPASGTLHIPASCNARRVARCNAQGVELRSLIVDDSDHFLAAARELLEREGIAVVGVASTSEEALRLARELRPDVALVDIDLGEESGFELAKRLSAAGSGELTQVVLISAYPERDFADMIAKSPAAGFLAKPQLSASRIREIIGAGEDGSGTRSA
jgi:CheY-like chemotaxis protein